MTGYELQIDDGHGGSFSTIYNGQNQPGLLHYVATGLTEGLKYNARLRAYSYNGPGSWSSVLNTLVCGTPSDLS